MIRLRSFPEVVRQTKFIIFSCLLFGSSIAYSQSSGSVLKRKLTFEVHDERLEDVLLELADEGGFSFSYNPDLMPVDSLISLNVENSSVKTVLNVLLGKELELRMSGNHLVILKTQYSSGSLSSTGESRVKTYTVDGYLQNNQTGEYVASATVYDVNRLHSATSDDNGYFSLEIRAKDEVIGITIADPDFEDTTLVILNGNQNLKIGLDPMEGLSLRGPGENTGVRGGIGSGEVNKLKVTKFMASSEGIDRSGQMAVNTYRFGQVSFLPFLGTNLKMSGMVENKVSLNILGGYNGATNGLEIGGLFNITRYHVKGFQVAGLGNVAGTETEGFQLAGIFNTNLGTVKGLQISGINNLALDSLKGVQIAGINNIVTGHTRGLQLAGINNLASKNVDGFQVAGISNVALKDVNKLQFAGITNFGRNVKGGQFAGIFNISYGRVSGGQFAGIFNVSSTVKTVQLAGIMNVAKDTVEGVQLTSLINFTRHNKGFQLAVLNIADTVSGTSIGLINIVLRGYNKIEIHANEVLPLSARVKFGTRKFYNIVGFGTQGFAPENVWGYTYGIGSAIGVGKEKRNEISFDLTLTDLQDDDSWIDVFNFNSRLSILYSKYIAKKIMVFVGPTWSQLIYDPANLQQDSFLSDFAPYTLYEGTLGGWNVEGWVGFEFGVRLL